MKKIKEDIPTAEALHTRLHTIMESGLANFVSTTNARRISVRTHVRFAVMSGLFALSIVGFLFAAQVDLNTLFGKIISMTLLLWLTVLLVSGKSWFIGSTLLAREVNMALVPILASMFDRTLLYTYNESKVDAVAELLNDSQLLVDEVTNLKVSSIYTIFSEFEMKVHEVKFDQKTKSPSGKMTVAHATFIDVNISNEEVAPTILASTGSRFGFSQQGLVQHLQNNESLHSIEIADKNLKAFSTDTVAGNNFLKKATLQMLSDWKKDAEENIRVMRKGTKLYILVPASQKGTAYISTSTKQKSIERYASVIARPIWRALMLAEEVRE